MQASRRQSFKISHVRHLQRAQAVCLVREAPYLLKNLALCLETDRGQSLVTGDCPNRVSQLLHHDSGMAVPSVGAKAKSLRTRSHAAHKPGSSASRHVQSRLTTSARSVSPECHLHQNLRLELIGSVMRRQRQFSRDQRSHARSTAHRTRSGARFSADHVLRLRAPESCRARRLSIKFNGCPKTSKHFPFCPKADSGYRFMPARSSTASSPRPCSDRSNADGYRGRGRGDPPVCRAAAPCRPPVRAQRAGLDTDAEASRHPR